MARVILTRHGETEWNVSGFVQGSQDSPLTKAGVLQAQNLARRLKNENIKILLSSPLGRALSTAGEIAKELNIPVAECAEFREISFGNWEGKPWRQLTELDPEGFRIWEKSPHIFQFPGGETFSDVLGRAKEKLLQLCTTYPNETICVVSHGITLKVLVTDLMGFGLENWMETPWQSNTAVNIFEVNNNVVTPLVVGDCTHNS